MKKLQKASDNLPIIIGTLLNNQNLCKLLLYQDKYPLTHDDITDTKSAIFFSRLFPFPPDQSVGTDDTIQLRVYYPSLDIVVTSDNTTVCFDVVLSGSKDIWCIGIDGKDKMRHIEIQQEIVNSFYDKDVGLGAKLNFTTARLYNVNDKYYTWTFYAEMKNSTSGKK